MQAHCHSRHNTKGKSTFPQCFSDDYDFNEENFRKVCTDFVRKLSITETEISEIEIQTRGQSENTQDISGPEASFELSGLALWRCSRQFMYLSMTGSRRLERDGNTATPSTPLDKYLARPHDQHCSWFQL